MQPIYHQGLYNYIYYTTFFDGRTNAGIHVGAHTEVGPYVTARVRLHLYDR